MTESLLHLSIICLTLVALVSIGTGNNRTIKEIVRLLIALFRSLLK